MNCIDDKTMLIYLVFCQTDYSFVIIINTGIFLFRRINRRYMAEVLLIQRNPSNSQSINQEKNYLRMHCNFSILFQNQLLLNRLQM